LFGPERIHMEHPPSFLATRALQTQIKAHPMVVQVPAQRWAAKMAGALGCGVKAEINSHNFDVCRLCQHRWIAVAGMTGFRNNAGTSAMTNWVSPSSQQIAFGRSKSGDIACISTQPVHRRLRWNRVCSHQQCGFLLVLHIFYGPSRRFIL